VQVAGVDLQSLMEYVRAGHAEAIRHEEIILRGARRHPDRFPKMGTNGDEPF
jgi:hypothetical protein